MIRCCAACDSTDTYINKQGIQVWHNHNKDDNFLCQSCYDLYVQHPAYNPYKMYFLGEEIYVKCRPRKGICESCKKKIGDTYIDYYGEEKIITSTQIHHDEYDITDPLNHTRELCPGCHNKARNRVYAPTEYVATVTMR